MNTYQIVIDGSIWNLYRKNHNFKTDSDAINFARNIERKHEDATSIQVCKKVNRRWVSVI